jgi:hypothetical protein
VRCCADCELTVADPDTSCQALPSIRPLEPAGRVVTEALAAAVLVAVTGVPPTSTSPVEVTVTEFG